MTRVSTRVGAWRSNDGECGWRSRQGGCCGRAAYGPLQSLGAWQEEPSNGRRTLTMGFQTAGGKAVTVTAAMRAKGAALLDTSPFKAMKEAGDSHAGPSLAPSALGFQSGNGRAMGTAATDAARTRALALLGLGGDDDDAELLRLCEGDKPAPSALGGAMPKPAPPRAPPKAFQTAGGATVSIEGSSVSLAAPSLAAPSRPPLRTVPPPAMGGGSSRAGFKPPRPRRSEEMTKAQQQQPASTTTGAPGAHGAPTAPAAPAAPGGGKRPRFVAPRSAPAEGGVALAAPGRVARAAFYPRAPPQAQAVRHEPTCCSCARIAPLHTRSLCSCCCPHCGLTLLPPGFVAVHARGCANDREEQ